MLIGLLMDQMATCPGDAAVMWHLPYCAEDDKERGPFGACFAPLWL